MSLKQRTRRLEEKAAAPAAREHVVAPFFGDEDTAVIRGEELTLDEFHRRYPSGVAVIYEEDVPEPDAP